MKEQVIDLVGKNRGRIVEAIQEKIELRDPDFWRMREIEDELERVDKELGLIFVDDGTIKFESAKTKQEMTMVFGSELFGKRMLLQQELLSFCDPDWVEKNL